MAVLKQTSPTASPTAPTPTPCNTVPSASASTPVQPGNRSRLMSRHSFWANGGVGSESPTPGQCAHIARRRTQEHPLMSETYVDPGREAWEVFKGLPRDQPIHMLNLIRLRDRAEYPPGHPRHGQDISGREAYREYGRTIAPHLARLGGRQVWGGAPQLMVTGPISEAWDLAF